MNDLNESLQLLIRHGCVVDAISTSQHVAGERIPEAVSFPYTP